MLLGLLAAVAGAWPLPASSRNQEFSDFRTPQPIRRGETLVLGIVGGWERWDQDNRGVGRLAVTLRRHKRPGMWVETVENHKLHLGQELIRRVFDWNRNGRLDAEECRDARLILYGQSLGGRAVVRLSRDLNALPLPVLLAVTVDSFGRHSRWIPPNVAAAVNYFQRESWPVVGQPEIRAVDPQRTRILGNHQRSYRRRPIAMPGESWLRRTFLGAHLKMEYDRELWAEIETLILKFVPPPDPP